MPLNSSLTASLFFLSQFDIAECEPSQWSERNKQHSVIIHNRSGEVFVDMLRKRAHFIESDRWQKILT